MNDERKKPDFDAARKKLHQRPNAIGVEGDVTVFNHGTADVNEIVYGALQHITAGGSLITTAKKATELMRLYPQAVSLSPKQATGEDLAAVDAMDPAEAKTMLKKVLSGVSFGMLGKPAPGAGAGTEPGKPATRGAR